MNPCRISGIDGTSHWIQLACLIHLNELNIIQLYVNKIINLSNEFLFKKFSVKQHKIGALNGI